MSVSMEDRELLELAAEAVGYQPWGSDCEGNPIFVVDSMPIAWNPLADDAEALRLAMKLGICIQFIPQCDTVQVYQEREFTAEPFNVHVAGLGDIETRRVITQAAAEIGKALQEKH